MTDRKNILLISLDDAFAYWKYRSAFGVELQTPNLDRICAESTAFQSAYCQVPVCGPSRSSFMSALTPHELGIFDNYTNVFDVLRPEQIWSYRLKQEGYYCSNAGKVHHRFKPLPAEIHNVLYSHPPEALTIGPGKNAKTKNFGGLMKGLGTTDPKFDAKYYDAQSAASATDFLQSYDRDAPFYREVGFYHPHSPYKTPVRFKDMYDEEAFTQPDAWKTPHDRNAFADLFMQENLDASQLGIWRKSLRNYFSAFSHVDHHIGKVWDALKASKHADNTIVVILADHGYHVGDKNRFRKLTLFEEAAGVPIIIHDPSDPTARAVTDPVALLDVGPTVLDYADCPPIFDCAGISLRPQVAGEDVTGRAVPTFFFGSAAIRKGDYRYIQYQDGSCQLFNIKDDLWQLKDLSGSDPARKDMHAALIATCRTYGLELLDPANTAPGPNAYCSVTRGLLPPDHLTGQGAMSTGSLTAQDVSPAFRKHFAILPENGTIGMPDGIRSVYLASDYSFGTDYFGIVGNDRGNLINFIGGHARFLLDIECGSGNDTVLGHLDPMRVRLNAGDNLVVTGHTGAEIFAGAGRDRIQTADGDNEIHGGSGTMHVVAGKGRDVITTGGGAAHIVSEGGHTEIVLDQGQSLVEIKGGEITLIARRSGQIQQIKGFTGGQIDLTDWAVLGPVDLHGDANGDTIVTAGTERVRFVGTSVDVIRSAITSSGELRG